MLALRRVLAALAVLLAVIAAAGGQPAELAPVLFPERSDWQMGNYLGGKADLTVALVDGVPVWRTGHSGLTLTSKEKLAGAVELRLRFRMTSPEDRGGVTSSSGPACRNRTAPPGTPCTPASPSTRDRSRRT